MKTLRGEAYQCNIGIFLNFKISKLWSIQSNALLKSIKMTTVYTFMGKTSKTSCLKIAKLVTFDCPERKPCY